MARINIALSVVLRNPLHCLAFGFGSGLSPKAPGTVGTLAAIPLYLLLEPLPLLVYGLLVLLSAVAGIFICDYSSKSLGVHDHPGIVWDEMVGYWITMFAVPLNWWSVVLGFLLFRFFDILKPWPISWADKRVSGGLGIMLDDVLAGLMACLVLQALVRLW